MPSPVVEDPVAESWVESANVADADFPLQNLPYGRFRRPGQAAWSVGVAIGDQVLDLARTSLDPGDMAQLMSLSRERRVALRRALTQGLQRGSVQRDEFESALVSQADVELGVPCEVGDYTDFYVGIHHATAVGRQFRPDNPLLPNYMWVPIGYHGRSSTIGASGHRFPRPRGQVKAPDAAEPTLRSSARLDFELELGFFIGRPNAWGEPVPIEQAEEHVFGVALFNDWSARDIQAWEYQPLGPFLGKNFASTVSPWMVTLEALEPFRRPWERAPGQPQPLPYLDCQRNRERGSIGIQLETWLQTANMRDAGHPGDCISRSGFAEAAYWTIAQLVTHHTVNGCALRTGDMLGSGTLSGPEPAQAGSLLELTDGGKRPIELSNGERRTFLEDGDTVILKGHCSAPGRRRIGFGECRATVLPAKG